MSRIINGIKYDWEQVVTACACSYKIFSRIIASPSPPVPGGDVVVSCVFIDTQGVASKEYISPAFLKDLRPIAPKLVEKWVKYSKDDLGTISNTIYPSKEEALKVVERMCCPEDWRVTSIMVEEDE